MIKRINKFAAIIFVTAAIFSSLLNLKNFGAPPSGGGDDYYYNRIAQNLLEHGRFASNPTDSANVSEPLYPLFIAGLYKIFGVKNYDFGPANFDAVRIVQTLLFALTCVLIYFIARSAGREKTARGAAILTVLFFPLAGITGRLLREVLFAFLTVLAIWLILKAQKTRKLTWFALAGLALGLATLTNAILEFFIVFIVFGFVLLYGKNFFSKPALLRVAVLTACFFVITVSWSLRHFGSSGSASLNMKSGGVISRKAEMINNIRGATYRKNLGGLLFGYYFFDKNGFNKYDVFLNSPDTTAKYTVMQNQHYSVKKINDTLTRESLPIVAHNIPRFIAISFLDFLQLNNLMLPNPSHLDSASPGQNLFINNSHPEIGGPMKAAIVLALHAWLWLFFGLTVFGLIKAAKNWQQFIWPALIAVYLNLVYAAAFGIPRYGMPIYPFYFIFFILGLAAAHEKFKLKKSAAIQ